MDVDIQERAPEHKSGIAGEDSVVTQGEVMRLFEHFKAENDANLTAIVRGRSSGLQDQKVARMEQRLDKLTLKSARPAVRPRRHRTHARRARAWNQSAGREFHSPA